jgi:hypothetical protein
MKLPKTKLFLYFPPRVIQVDVLAMNRLRKTHAVQTAIEEYLEEGISQIETEEGLKEALKVEAFGQSFSEG